MQVKKQTGGSQVKTRRMYGQPMTFKPTHLPVLVTNFQAKV